MAVAPSAQINSSHLVVVTVTHGQVNVPARRPLDVTGLEHDIVRPRHGQGGLPALVRRLCVRRSSARDIQSERRPIPILNVMGMR